MSVTHVKTQQKEAATSLLCDSNFLNVRGFFAVVGFGEWSTDSMHVCPSGRYSLFISLFLQSLCVPIQLERKLTHRNDTVVKQATVLVFCNHHQRDQIDFQLLQLQLRDTTVPSTVIIGRNPGADQGFTQEKSRPDCNLYATLVWRCEEFCAGEGGAPILMILFAVTRRHPCLSVTVAM